MLLEAHHRGDESDPKDVVRVVKAAVELIGTANAHMSNLWRVKVIGDINKALIPLVGDDTNFVEAPPLLFGMEFAQKGKEMVDQVKAMRSTFTSKLERTPPFFRNGPPGNWGGGGLQSQVQKGRSPKFPLWSRKTRQGEEPPRTATRAEHKGANVKIIPQCTACHETLYLTCRSKGATQFQFLCVPWLGGHTKGIHFRFGCM